MWSEIEFENLKKIFLEEVGCSSLNKGEEKEFYEKFETGRNLDLSEVHDEKEAIDQICEKLEIPLELAAFFKDNFVNDPALSPEEHLKIECVLAKSFFVLNKSGTKATWSSSGKKPKKS